MMEHDQAAALLTAYLDRELGVAETLALEHHLDGCASCRAAQAEQQALIARCRADAPYFRAGPELRRRIAAALPPAAAATSAGPPAVRHGGLLGALRERLGSLAWPPQAVLATALFALTLATGLYLAVPSDEDRLAEELVAGHVRSLQVDHLSDVASSDQHTVKPWFNGKIDFAPPVVDLAAQGFKLEGGRLDYLHGHAAAVLVYRHGPHPINVYIWPAAGGDAAPQLRDQQGYHLAGWRAGGMQYWAVSDLARDEMNALVDALRH